MRLRQVALMAHKVAPVAEALEAVFDLKVAFRDPGVGVFGLANVVMPAGGEFIEVLEPVRADASGARYLARRGGDAGYMVILQDSDALAHRARIEAMGVRSIAKSRTERYRYTHFHPGDCAGVLLSIDSVDGDGDWTEPMSDWPPAGEDWRAFDSDLVLGIVGVTIQSRDPDAAAQRFADLLQHPVTETEAGRQLLLDRAFIRFVPPIDADGTGVVGIDLLVEDPHAVLARAQAHGCPVEDDLVHIGGVAFRAVGAE
jgi:hypothetical protein